MNVPQHPILAFDQVSKAFSRPAATLVRATGFFSRASQASLMYAVDGVSLSVGHGEVVGLVGESGSGKSTLGRIAVGLLAPSSGKLLWHGKAVSTLDAQASRRRRLAAQMIFQDPYASLNPRMRIADLIGEAPVVHGLVPPLEQANYVATLLQKVGLDASLLQRYPYQLSGGQRARIGIARALAVRPQFLVCDEAVAALDVSVQAQVINLFMQLRAELGLSYLFISHDLGVVRHVADRIAVMFRGKIVEIAPAEALFSQAMHPYTVELLAAMPTLDTTQRKAIPVVSGLPSRFQPPAACRFQARCPHAMPQCQQGEPALQEVKPGHSVACFLHERRS